MTHTLDDFSTFKKKKFLPSPACPGGIHRSIESKEYEKTPEALEHNHLFVRMTQLIHQAKAKNPHLIVVIENPVGLLSKMPLMLQLEKTFNLYRSTVDYCAFGRFDKKPTHLWSNVSFVMEKKKDCIPGRNFFDLIS